MSAATNSPFASMFGKWLLAILMTAAVILMLLFLAGVFHPKVPMKSQGAASQSVDDLKTVVVKTIKRQRFETASGTVKPVHESAVASKLLAKVIEMNVIAGQTVSQDQILVKLDDADLQARLNQAKAGLTNAQVLRDKASIDFGRMKTLKEKNAVSAADYDAANSAMKSSEATLEQSIQAVREFQVMLDYATIRSPMSGTVIDKRVEVGDTVSPGQILLTLFDPTHMQMVASVRESLALKLKPGQVLPTRLDALNLDCEATISELVPEADVASRSFTVKVTGPCPPGAYSGMFGRLMLPLEDEEILIVPATAVQRVGQLTMVEVVQNQMISRRNVRLGRTLDSDVEVLSGLIAGEVVVVR